MRASMRPGGNRLAARPIRGNPTRATELHPLAPPPGRLPVNLAVVPPVDRRDLRRAASCRLHREDEG